MARPKNRGRPTKAAIAARHKYAKANRPGLFQKHKYGAKDVFSPRPETKARSPMVQYKPYPKQVQQTRGQGALSTAIKEFKYNERTQILRITFWGYKQRYVGSTYAFHPVNKDLFDGFEGAGSKGRFFYYMIRSETYIKASLIKRRVAPKKPGRKKKRGRRKSP